MFQAVRQGTKWYVLQVDEIDEDELENIRAFIEEGTPVLLADSLEGIQEILVDEDVEIVSDDAG